MALNFPFEMFMQAQQEKNRNQQQMDQNMEGLGAGLGNGMDAVGQIIREKKKKDAINQLIQLMGQGQGQSNQPPPPPQQPPEMPSMSPPSPQAPMQPQSTGQVPPGQPMSSGPSNIGQDVQMPQRQPIQMPQGQPPSQQIPPLPGQQPFNGMDQSKLMSLYSKYDPQGFQQLIGQMIKQRMGTSTLNPLQQAQADYYKARTGSLQGGSGKTTWYESPDGTISRTPSEGSFPVQMSDAQGAQYTAIAKSSKAKNEAMSSRGEAMQRGIDARQIDRLAQSVGVTQAQRNLLQQNNMRANRAIELAQKPMTWQEFGAVTTDAAAIMQGGSPQVQQLHEMSYPSWKQDLARAQTYMTSTPTANVPEEFKNRIINMIQGIQQVDNRYLKKNSEFMQKMLAPTIRGGIGQFKGPIDDMTKTITETGGGQDNSDPLGIR